MSIPGSHLDNPSRARHHMLGLLALIICVGAGYALMAHAISAQASANPDGWEAVQLVSQRVSVSPVIDGGLEVTWESAPAVDIPLTWGAHSTEHALHVQMRSAHTDEAVFFFASWEGSPPTRAADTIRNRLTMHYDMAEPWPGARDVACLVACHTAYTDGTGRLAHVTAETIPTGQTDPLPSAGGWSDGRWNLEWSRPLVHDNLFDVQFHDLEEAYSFFLKVFEGKEGLADPVSSSQELVFRR